MFSVATSVIYGSTGSPRLSRYVGRRRPISARPTQGDQRCVEDNDATLPVAEAETEAEAESQRHSHRDRDRGRGRNAKQTAAVVSLQKTVKDVLINFDEKVGKDRRVSGQNGVLITAVFDFVFNNYF